MKGYYFETGNEKKLQRNAIILKLY